MSQISSMQI